MDERSSAVDLEALGRRLAIEDQKPGVDKALARGWITWAEWCHRILEINLMTGIFPWGKEDQDKTERASASTHQEGAS